MPGSSPPPPDAGADGSWKKPGMAGTGCCGRADGQKEEPPPPSV